MFVYMYMCVHTCTYIVYMNIMIYLCQSIGVLQLKCLPSQKKLNPLNTFLYILIYSQSLLQIVFCQKDTDVDLKPLNMIRGKFDYLISLESHQWRKSYFKLWLKFWQGERLCNPLLIFLFCNILIVITCCDLKCKMIMIWFLLNSYRAIPGTKQF